MTPRDRENNTMTCDTWQPLISSYADGQLDGDSRARVQAHLQECPSCARLAEDFRAMSGFLGGLPRRQTSQQFEARLSERLAQTRRPVGLWERLTTAFPRPGASPVLRPALALAAACGLVGGGTYLTRMPAVVIPTPAPVSEPALVSHCLQQHRNYVASQPLSDISAQSLANQLDETGPPVAASEDDNL